MSLEKYKLSSLKDKIEALAAKAAKPAEKKQPKAIKVDVVKLKRRKK